MSLKDVLRPEVPTLWSIEREHGWDNLRMIVTTILAQVDVSMGGDGNPAKCEMWAAQVLSRPDIRGRSLSYLILALRDGIARYTVHDKRIGLDQINKMLNDRDQEITNGLACDDEVGDAALRGEMERMDKEENKATEERSALKAHIAELREKLRNK